MAKVLLVGSQFGSCIWQLQFLLTAVLLGILYLGELGGPVDCAVCLLGPAVRPLDPAVWPPDPAALPPDPAVWPLDPVDLPLDFLVGGGCEFAACRFLLG